MPTTTRRTLTEHTSLVDEFFKQNPPIVFAREKLLRYEDGLWTPWPEYLVRGEILQILRARSKNKITASMLNSVLSLIRDSHPIRNDLLDSKPDLLRCGNGTLELSTRTLRPYSKDDYLTSGVSFNYDPSAKAPAWAKYIERLEKVLSPEIVSFLQEFVGLCVTTDTQYEKAIWLHGPPGSGKSTFIDGIANTLKDRTCHLNLINLEHSQFALCDIPGKTLIVCHEQPGGLFQSAYLLDLIISGEVIHVERKYYDAQEIIPVGHVLFATNELPELHSANSGLIRRLSIVEFPVVPLSERDPQVKKQIQTESAGIFNWMLTGLDHLKTRAQFLIPQQVINSTIDFQKSNDIEAAFVTEKMRTGVGLEITEIELYKFYKEWCRDTGHRAKPSTKMVHEWKRLGFQRIERNNSSYISGITF